jgi:hypothetical protein
MEATTTLTQGARYKGKLLKARVLRNGVVSFDGRRFRSPSMGGTSGRMIAHPEIG